MKRKSWPHENGWIAELAAAGTDWIVSDLRSLALANNANDDVLFLSLDGQQPGN